MHDMGLSESRGLIRRRPQAQSLPLLPKRKGAMVFDERNPCVRAWAKANRYHKLAKAKFKAKFHVLAGSGTGESHKCTLKEIDRGKNFIRYECTLCHKRWGIWFPRERREL
jgi:hypothetical protein